MNTNPSKNPKSAVATTFRELAGTLRSFPAPFWILIGGSFLNRVGTFVIPFLTLYLTRKGHSLGAVGTVLGAYGLGHLVASLAGGQLADRIGRRNTIALSMFSTAAVMLLLIFARDYWTIVGLMFLAGLTAELYRPASSALVADYVPPERRVVAFAVYRLAVNAGWACGPAMGGFLARHSYAWLFVGDAFTSVLFGLVAWRALPAGGAHGSGQSSGWMGAIQTAFRDPRFTRVFVAAFAIGCIYMQMFSTFGLHVVDQGFTEVHYGLLISMNGVLVVFAELPLAAWVQRFAVKRALGVGFGLIGLGFSILGLVPNLSGFLLGVVVLTVGEMVSMPVASAYVANLAPLHLRGSYMGVFGTTWAASLIVAPGIGLQVYRGSALTLWLSCGLLGLMAVVILGWGKSNTAVSDIQTESCAPAGAVGGSVGS